MKLREADRRNHDPHARWSRKTGELIELHTQLHCMLTALGSTNAMSSKRRDEYKEKIRDFDFGSLTVDQVSVLNDVLNTFRKQHNGYRDRYNKCTHC